MTAPHRPVPVVEPGTPSHRLIRGALKMDLDALHVECVWLHRGADWSVALVDTGDGGAWTSDSDTTFHVLWEREEDDAWVDVDGERHPIAPGDTMSVPAGARLRIAGGILYVRIDFIDRHLDRVLPPNHGVEAFQGYNRRTDYDTPGAFSLERWKITQPLRFGGPETPYAIIAVATSLALMWSGGVDRIRSGECRVVGPGTGSVTLLPDGLGYALIVR
jgi:hypothetical protein